MGTRGHVVRLVSDAASSLARLGSSSGLGLISTAGTLESGTRQSLVKVLRCPWRSPVEAEEGEDRREGER